MRSNYLLLLFFVNINCSHKKTQENAQKIDKIDTSEYFLLKDQVNKDDNKNTTEMYISAYIDSLDNPAGKDSALPLFLFDPQFDYRHRAVWSTLHTPVSVRGQIINRVNKCEILKRILASKNNDLRKKPFIEDELPVPDMDLSTYDLVLKRVRELGCQ